MKTITTPAANVLAGLHALLTAQMDRYTHAVRGVGRSSDRHACPPRSDCSQTGGRDGRLIKPPGGIRSPAGQSSPIPLVTADCFSRPLRAAATFFFCGVVFITAAAEGTGRAADRCSGDVVSEKTDAAPHHSAGTPRPIHSRASAIRVCGRSPMSVEISLAGSC